MRDERIENDIVIVGAGLAGLFLALKLSPSPVTVVTSAKLGKGASSSWAQGGIAAALDKGDTAFAHAFDTMEAGAGLVNPHIAHILTSEAAARIDDLLAWGTPFDRDRSGELLLSREAAHSARRVVRVKGDRAGWAIMNALIKAVRAHPNIRIMEGYTARKLVVKGGAVRGVHAWTGRGQHVYLPAQAIVLAAGGIGALYRVTTNPKEANGEALAMAARAGAFVADAEFVQFHPTAINADIDPAPLATEALRGEGALLVNGKGERFMQKLHDEAELAPRDIVARAVFRENVSGRQAFLDCREAIGDRFETEFPAVYKKCRQAGIDPVREPIPIAPAAHFHMGGIFTDAFGRTTLNGLWACGEVAASGAHGANRLASNSLLEAVVFAARIAGDLVDSGFAGPLAGGRKAVSAPVRKAPDMETVIRKKHHGDIARMREIMDRHVGLERNEEGLLTAIRELDGLLAKYRDHLSLGNMLTAAKIIAVSALLRKESRGGHFRIDYPDASPALARRVPVSLTRLEEAAADALQNN